MIDKHNKIKAGKFFFKGKDTLKLYRKEHATTTAPSFVDADCLNKTGSVSKAKENKANQQKKMNTQGKKYQIKSNLGWKNKKAEYLYEHNTKA